ncbi:hypothetical protein EMIHUDRAFT_454156 [Emiliania huxleyi CCMP1516]|uniref:Tyrosine specific protein phosphatases domain-containing protein n=2 Tax=Emiliania huxleyi TaxID=2903 RepID=A0A0D3KY48_EMIH1|nr:hypothetical protein EMIHUDRAFT_454156 [Emiliania huxleyi CCMP1516]EOD40683.1 hypothetical protein EMIHUDRAFT_454156 [Emiliania huxleyi CCMP1516]|eukprot:XP_005793112.1 hypothetical protein EMIHUDRAFT_454156 [Emiliania huxleyi CCMP1516]
MPLRSLLVYSAATHGLFAGLFVARVGMGILGKQRAAGVVPWWSYLVWAPFHSFTYLYTYFHTLHSEAHGTPVATEVAPGWWIGGRYAHWRMPERRWAATIDLTCEFPEGSIRNTSNYLLTPCWDGVPPTPAQIEEAARLAARACGQGDVMVHCAHGRGRSTTVMLACLVRAGLFSDWRDAFEAEALDTWEARYGTAPYSVSSPRPSF